MAQPAHQTVAKGLCVGGRLCCWRGPRGWVGRSDGAPELTWRTPTTEIAFLVEEAPEGGLTARAPGESIVTQPGSIEALCEKVRDAVHCHLKKAELLGHPAALHGEISADGMRLPQHMDAPELIKALQSLGNRAVRQSRSLIRVQIELPKPHALAAPNHSFLKLEALTAIPDAVAQHRSMSRDELAQRLFQGWLLSART